MGKRIYREGKKQKLIFQNTIHVPGAVMVLLLCLEEDTKWSWQLQPEVSIPWAVTILSAVTSLSALPPAQDASPLLLVVLRQCAGERVAPA